jgi:hypothetical protein
VREARGLACRAAGGFPAGACTTASLALAPGGSRADPAVSLRVELVASWLSLWSSLAPLDQASVQAVWTKIADEMPRRGCAQSRGPISATIYALRWAGWLPLAADRWQEPEPRGDTGVVDPDSQFDTAPILARFALAVQVRLWRRAELHYLGKGLEHGPPEIASLRARVRSWRAKAGRRRQPCSRRSPAGASGLGRGGTNAR